VKERLKPGGSNVGRSGHLVYDVGALCSEKEWVGNTVMEHELNLVQVAYDATSSLMISGDETSPLFVVQTPFETDPGQPWRIQSLVATFLFLKAECTLATMFNNQVSPLITGPLLREVWRRMKTSFLFRFNLDISDFHRALERLTTTVVVFQKNVPYGLGSYVTRDRKSVLWLRLTPEAKSHTF